jgi:hypothetical protein
MAFLALLLGLRPTSWMNWTYSARRHRCRLLARWMLAQIRDRAASDLTALPPGLAAEERCAAQCEVVLEQFGTLARWPTEMELEARWIEEQHFSWT